MQLNLYGIVAKQCKCHCEESRGEGVSCTYVMTAVTRTWLVRYMYRIASTVAL
jgi:hypothetical protein